MKEPNGVAGFMKELQRENGKNKERLDFIDDLSDLIDKLWALTSDFVISSDDLTRRSIAWAEVFKPQLFDKYLNYTVKACLASREKKGAIHADEFLQTHIKVKAGLVWAPMAKEWIPLVNLICDLYESRTPDDILVNHPEPTPAIQAQIEAQIYGWED